MLTPEQIETRRTGISASEISAVVGLNPWSGPGDVWSDKLGMTEPWDGNEDTERGNELEEALVRWTGRRLKAPVQPNRETYRSEKDPLALATPDGFLIKEEIGYQDQEMTRTDHKRIATIEVKTPSWRTEKDWIDPAEVQDGCPKYYLVQAQWQAGVLGLDTAYVSGLIDGRLWTYRLEFSAPLFNALLERAHEFWRYVERKEPPPFQPGQDPGWIGRVYRSQADEQLIDPPQEKLQDVIHASQTYLDASTQKASAEVAMRAAKGYLCSLVGDHAGLRVPGMRLTWKQDKASVVTDWEGVAHEALGLLAGTLPVEEIDKLISRFQGEKPGVRRFLLKTEEKTNGRSKTAGGRNGKN